ALWGVERQGVGGELRDPRSLEELRILRSIRDRSRGKHLMDRDQPVRPYSLTGGFRGGEVLLAADRSAFDKTTYRRTTRRCPGGEALSRLDDGVCAARCPRGLCRRLQGGLRPPRGIGQW